MGSRKFSITITSGILVSALGINGVALGATCSDGCSQPPPPPDNTKKDAAIKNGQPSSNQGLANFSSAGGGAGFMDALGGAVGGFSGGGSGSLTGNFKRFALGRRGETGAAAAPGGQNWNAWAAVSHSNIGYSFAPLSSSGQVNVYLGGVDYTFDNNLVFGVAVAADYTNIDEHFNAGKVTGNGTTVSPYVGYPLTNKLVVDGSIGYGKTDFDTAVAGVTGSYRTDRYMGTLGISYRETKGAWQFTGRGAFLTVHNKLGAYTLSNSTAVQEATVNLSQVRAYGQAAYDAGMFTPYVGVSFIYDVHHPDQLPVLGVASSNDRSGWTPAVGVRFRTKGTVYGAIQYSSEQSRSEVKNNQLLFNVGLRF